MQYTSANRIQSYETMTGLGVFYLCELHLFKQGGVTYSSSAM